MNGQLLPFNMGSLQFMIVVEEETILAVVEEILAEEVILVVGEETLVEEAALVADEEMESRELATRCEVMLQLQGDWTHENQMP